MTGYDADAGWLGLGDAVANVVGHPMMPGVLYTMLSEFAAYERYRTERRWYFWALAKHKRRVGRAARKRLNSAKIGPHTPLGYHMFVHGPPVAGSPLAAVTGMTGAKEKTT